MKLTAAVHGNGFPLELSPAKRDETPHRDFPLSERASTEGTSPWFAPSTTRCVRCSKTTTGRSL